MIDKNAVFTFTLLYRDEDDKVILITSGETPAKSEEEAESVMSSANEDEASAVDKLISKLFKDAEPGSEESISASLQEFEDKFEISLEELEDEVGQDLDNDQEEDEDAHIEKVLDDSEKDEKEESEPSCDLEEPDGAYEGNPTFALISIDSLTDPMSIIPGMRSRFTSPSEFLDEEETEMDEGYEVVLVATDDNEEVLEEAATPSALIAQFVDRARATHKGIFTIADVTELFNQLHVTDPDAKLHALQLCLPSGNIRLFQHAGKAASHGRLEIAGEPFLVIDNAPASAIPTDAVEVPQSGISQALSRFVGRF